jgi:hypothetical protein
MAAHLRSCGSLGDAPGTGRKDTYLYDPRQLSSDASGTANDCAPSQIPPLLLRPIFPVDRLTDPSWMEANEGKMLVYESAPFATAVELTGFFQLSVWLSIDQPDTDFLVAVFEVGGKDGSLLLTSDIMRARYRESLREERLIYTTEPLRYDFNRFTFVSRQVRSGSRLRLLIGPLSSIFHQRNHNSGNAVAEESMADARTVTVRLFHDEAHPSALHVPFGVDP